MANTKWTTRALGGSTCALVLVVSIFLTGCPTAPTDNGTDPTAGRGITVTLVSPTTGFGVSVLDSQPITVIYSVVGTPDEIRGYYVPIAGNDPTSEPLGDPVIVDGALPAGENRFFSFTPASAGVGFFRVGVIAIVGNTQIQRESNGVIEVQDHPDPIFLEPDQAITVVEQGGSIVVRFNARDPQNVVRWRLFYLAPGDSQTSTPDLLGTTLGQPGSGNVGQFTWEVGNLPPGDYRLGLAATDSGFSVTQTVARGLTDRIFTIPNSETTTPIVRVVAPATSMPPTLAFTSPGNDDIDLFRDETFTIRFAGQVRVPGATGLIDIFYDTDRSVTNGVTLILDDVPASTTTAEFPKSLAEGTYNVGGTIRDGLNQPVTVYATGKVIVSKTLSVDVTSPATSHTFRPGEPINIGWTAKGPAGRGTFDVFAQRLNADGTPRGNPISVGLNLPRTRTSATFTTNTSGLYEFRVVLKLPDGTTADDKSPAKVRVSSLPAIVWTGLLADPTGPYQGAVFGGANFEDNAGSTLSPAGDLNEDGNSEFVIVSRYGKPFFVNPDGIGPGEGYIIYGRSGSGKLRGEFNLNSVGLSQLRGVTLTGGATTSGITSGMSDVALLPDVDGDGRGELAFGFPRTNNQFRFFRLVPDGENPIANQGQMLRGGVIILSSNNRILADPGTGTSTTIDLDEVGFRFDNQQPSGGMILNDLHNFNDDEETGGMCELGTDDFYDDVTPDPLGFVATLAGPTSLARYLEDPVRDAQDKDFIFVGSDDSEEENVCRTTWAFESVQGPCGLSESQINEMNYMDGFGSRTYPPDAQIVDPRGARFLGPEPDAGFGTTIAVSRVLPGESGSFSLIVSAPSLNGEDRLGSGTTFANAGKAFIIPGLSYWSGGGVANLPGPYQYNVGAQTRCFNVYLRTGLWDPREQPRNRRQTTLISGNPLDRIENIEGIEDFNGDGRDDIAIGAPTANTGRGRLYVLYRRDLDLEADFVLSKLSLAPNSPDRLDGFQVITNEVGARLGSSMASGFDFDRDGIADLAVSLPGANNGRGAVLILFSARELVSPQGGFTVEQLLTTRRLSDGSPVAALIHGNPLDPSGGFGFNIANGGDLDGDGFDDLLIAAPNATPRFDPDPTDDTDVLTQAGIDLDGDGIADPVPGDQPGRPSLENAGLVYVIYGKNLLNQLETCSTSGTVCTANSDCPTGETCGGDMIININQLGSSQLAGFMLAGRRSGDRLGGGDAGDVNQGGIAIKSGRGRSRGLSTAGDVDGDNKNDILISSILADPRPNLQPPGLTNAGEVYLFYGASAPQ